MPWKRRPLSSFSSSPSISIFSDASWSSGTNSSGMGFIILASNGQILLAGSQGAVHPSPLAAELSAMALALEACLERGWSPSRICCDCPGIINLIENHHPCVAWKFNTEAQKLKCRLLRAFPDISMIAIPREDNNIADELAYFGKLNPLRSLFSRDLICPIWLLELCRARDLFF